MTRQLLALACAIVAAASYVGVANAAQTTAASCPTAGAVTATTPITITGGTASVSFTIAAGCTAQPVSLVSYTAPDSTFDQSRADQQAIFGTPVSQSLPAGTYTWSVAVPDCFFQVDLVSQAPIAHLGPAGSNNFYTQQGTLVSSLNGGTTTCESSSPPPPPPCSIPSALSNVGPITVSGDKAHVSFTVNEGCTISLTLVSYKAPGPTFDENTASQQVRFSEDHRESLSAGNYTLTVDVPSCYYQIDFVRGASIEQLGPAGSGNFYGDRLIESVNGGTNSCTETTTQTETPPVEQQPVQQVVVQAPVQQAPVVQAPVVQAPVQQPTAQPPVTTPVNGVAGVHHTIVHKKAKKHVRKKVKRVAKAAKAVVHKTSLTG